MYSRRVVSCPVPPRPCRWDCVYRHNWCGMKRTCWTGSLRCCLSLDVVSSIPARSTIIYRFLSGLIYAFPCPSASKLKPTNMCYASKAVNKSTVVSLPAHAEELHINPQDHLSRTRGVVQEITCYQLNTHSSRTMCQVSGTIITWRRHPMETFSALLALFAGNSSFTGEFPSQRPVTQSFDIFFDLRLE